jgi:hypothetical protein
MSWHVNFLRQDVDGLDVVFGEEPVMVLVEMASMLHLCINLTLVVAECLCGNQILASALQEPITKLNY